MLFAEDETKYQKLMQQLQDAETQGRLRKKLHKGIWFYSVVDVFSVILDVDRRTAKNNYHVFKLRCQRSDLDLFRDVISLRAMAADSKMYNTDFINFGGVRRIYIYLEHNLYNRKRRIGSGRDEIINFHPEVMDFLLQRGWDVTHHVSLEQGGIIDIVAQKNDAIYVVECKLELTGSYLYEAVGQVLCYNTLYQENSCPAIACRSTDEHARLCCKRLNIDVFIV